MTLHCFGCGVEKDMEVEEVSPHAEADGITDEPIPPLGCLECSGPDGFRMTVVCHSCFHRLSPDMWISAKCWESIDPKVAYNNLPPLADPWPDWRPESYPDVVGR